MGKGKYWATGAWRRLEEGTSPRGNPLCLRDAQAPVSGGCRAAASRALLTELLGICAMEMGTKRGSPLRRNKP